MAGSGRIVIAGGSGYIGANLAAHLTFQAGREVVVLSRRPEQRSNAWRAARWDGRTQGAWGREIDGADAIVNLTGRSVDCVKTPDHCDEILRSRVEPTRALGVAVRDAADPPKVWVQMSTAHIYGDPPVAVCDEDSAFGYGLAPTVGRAWEDAFHQSAPASVRRVILRTSFVLGRHGGALRRLAMLARWGLGGRIGHGRQGVSWIHERDLNRIFERALEDDSMQGAYIASSPDPVSNAEFMRTLRRALRRPFRLPSPAALVRLGAPLFLRTDPELAIYGRYCSPRRLMDAGFSFVFSTLDAAMRDLLEKHRPQATAPSGVVGGQDASGAGR